MKRFRIFAGPNGSGKSTLIEDIRAHYNIGYFVNADLIEFQLNSKGFIHCEDYLPIEVKQGKWNFFLKNIENKHIEQDKLQHIRIIDNVLVCPRSIDSYIAASIANFFRDILLNTESTFSFETVMSHPSKIDFLRKTKDKGFKTYLYFITTQDPYINIERIGHRVTKGGHNVSEKKVIDRYYRSMELLYEAFMVADSAFIFDSTITSRCSLLIEKKDNKMNILEDNIPEWIETYLLKKIKGVL